jgi:hypothetical protein
MINLISNDRLIGSWGRVGLAALGAAAASPKVGATPDGTWEAPRVAGRGVWRWQRSRAGYSTSRALHKKSRAARSWSRSCSWGCSPSRRWPPPAPAATTPIDSHDIAPLIMARCAECHTDGKYKGRSLDTREAMLKSEAIVPGKSGERADAGSRLTTPITAAPEGEPLTPTRLRLRPDRPGVRWEGAHLQAVRYAVPFSHQPRGATTLSTASSMLSRRTGSPPAAG